MAKLRALLSDVPGLEGVPDLDVTGLAYDSREVRPGHAFFALAGGTHDGHAFVASAASRGAVVAVGEREGVADGVTYVRVPDSRLALALASHAFYGDPSAELRVAGVTGTAGKTTTTFLLEAMLKAAGASVGVMGTVTIRYGEHRIPAPLTTLQSLDLARTMRAMRDAGVDLLAMEVTSHALDQHRVGGVRFDAVGFTNFSREHLDYHPDMEAYFEAKRRLFFDYPVASGRAIHLGDPRGRALADELGERALGYGLVEGAAVTARDVSLTDDGIVAEVVTPAGPYALRSPLLGEINLQNILAATSLAHLLGVSPEAMAEGARSLDRVPGRFENVGRAFGRRVIVDYSHKVDAMRRALTLVRELTPGRLITVFGCGGDRDRGKRPLMGEVAAELSDVVVVTSDNPRSEDPWAIIEAIEPGLIAAGARLAAGEALPVGRGSYLLVEDRRRAIEIAVEGMDPHDTVIICGKGHEAFQQVGEEQRRFDDAEEARAALGRDTP
ncbi:MAG: UDP-N-acetylmuramoyl-L-alanyl-D-glutamate--2,6-diaminopimelate ligase [Sandaracinaceae bacterium]|nr:UDP-N-acetylmuramoyl-L-alanyl-D-glutamate--2,6-diaminopimelate ligase [Sandaracinaceae bacterium]